MRVGGVKVIYMQIITIILADQFLPMWEEFIDAHLPFN